MVEDSGIVLPTSRISRLLRPLQTKCRVLALAGPSSRPRIHATTTYAGSSQASPNLNDGAPLTIIPPPHKLRALSHLDRASRTNITLSKMLYDVRDAFRNILQAVVPKAPVLFAEGVGGSRPKSSVSSLGAICAAVIGDHIEGQIADNRDERTGDEFAQDEDMEILNEYYDAVPGHYRHNTLVAHALSIILNNCPQNHTLFYILLEVVVNFGLKSQSEVLLKKLLETAFQPSPDLHGPGIHVMVQKSSISNAAHSNYLKSLRELVAESNAINDRAFVRILGQVVSNVPPSSRPEVWTSRAMIRLARRFRANDYGAFIALCLQLVLDVADMQSRRNAKKPEQPAYARLSDRLAKWLETLCERIVHTDHGSQMLPVDPTELQMAAELVTRAHMSGLCPHPSGEEALKPVDEALTCLALLCSSSPYLAGVSPQMCVSLEAMMRNYRGANVDTFNTLTSVALNNISKEDGVILLSAQVKESFASLRRWATYLHMHRMFLLEAWFWSNVLGHIEDLSPEIGSHYDTTLHRRPFGDELERLRKEVVRNIEEAERLHFDNGPTANSSNAAEQTPSKAASVAKGSQFRWEELVGCWVLKTPLPIKPRHSAKRSHPVDTDGEDVDSLDEHHTKRPCHLGTPTRSQAQSVCSATSLSSRVSSRSSRMSMAISPRESLSSSRLTTPDDQENVMVLPVKKARAARRRSSFASVLADARINRVVLHTIEREDEKKDARDSKHGGTPDGGRKETKKYLAPKRQVRKPRPAVHNLLSPGVCDVHQLSSDDLDLFSYRSSEW